MSYVQYDNITATISIDIPPDLFKSDALMDGMPEAIMDASLEARNFWESEAGRRLKSSRQRYIDAIALEQDGDEVHITLSGRNSGDTSNFAVKVELGSDSFDMKPGFLRSPKIKSAPIKMKIPRAVAASLPVGSPVTRWMIIPLNTRKELPGPDGKVANPTFRMFTDKSKGWNHPGLSGVHIADDVRQELAENILPKHIEKLIDNVFGRSGGS